MTTPTVKPRNRPAGRRPSIVYDHRTLTYANSFDNAVTRHSIKTLEWLTGKLTILRRVRRFERMGAPAGRAFWPATMKAMGIELQTPQAQLDRIPADGPVVFVANHPHGLVDGMILADLIGRRRDDYRILSRSILTGIDDSAGSYMIPVPFPHEPESQQKMIEMRKQAMTHLEQKGLIALFPSGVVATSKTMFGPVIEAEWNVFTAKMIRKSGATVVPCYFQGSNSRWYQAANQISSVLRQGLLIHEVVHAFDKPQAPIIGNPIRPEDWDGHADNPRQFMGWLRERTLSLKENPDQT
ncbi:lysophospholipid acyltransferase family protein [Rhodophyticola sp. CCM32]|uniref:lysophospholipid acyltransferase family protein n=1 Tax=Rhodophyticola sp. CCM32 TaxID=2916397 RepID=UPI001AEFAC01|nr:lysophospholipid acyltransferase family protein [Rhodophyticola sp. CCM32]